MRGAAGAQRPPATPACHTAWQRQRLTYAAQAGQLMPCTVVPTDRCSRHAALVHVHLLVTRCSEGVHALPGTRRSTQDDARIGPCAPWLSQPCYCTKCTYT